MKIGYLAAILKRYKYFIFFSWNIVVISVYTYGVKIIKKFRWESGSWGVPWNPPLCTNGSAGYLMQLSVNSINDAIKFTTEPEVKNSIAMLDTKITRHLDGSMTCGVYRKPTHTDQYLNFGSHHPLQHKLMVVRTLTHRANTIITREEDRQQEMHHIQNCLPKCGHEPWVFAVSNNKETYKQKAKYANRPPRKEVW